MILYGFASRGGGNVMLGDVSFERRNYRAVPGYLGLPGLPGTKYNEIPDSPYVLGS
jgi:hypothetical protein